MYRHLMRKAMQNVRMICGRPAAKHIQTAVKYVFVVSKRGVCKDVYVEDADGVRTQLSKNAKYNKEGTLYARSSYKIMAEHFGIPFVEEII